MSPNDNEIERMAELLVSNPDALKTLLVNMSVDAVRWRTALELISKGVENGQSLSSTKCKEIADDALSPLGH